MVKIWARDWRKPIRWGPAETASQAPRQPGAAAASGGGLLRAAREVQADLEEAFHATENLYYLPIRARLLEGCGDVCTARGAVRSPPGAGVSCRGLYANEALPRPRGIWPPPARIPRAFLDDFDWRFGEADADQVQVIAAYQSAKPAEKPEVRRCYQCDRTTSCDTWKASFVERLIDLYKAVDREGTTAAGSSPYEGGTSSFRIDDVFVGYPHDGSPSDHPTLLLMEDLKTVDVQGHWGVLGSQTPWLEALLLWRGADVVTTVEYDDLSACSTHPRIRTRTNAEFQRDPGVMDGWVQFSSIEHSGLGGYGDEINPWADRQWMAMLWCATKPSGLMLSGPGPGEGEEGVMWAGSPFKEKIYWNKGRDLS